MRCFCVVEHHRPLKWLDLPTPEPTGTEVLVQVKAAGLCHSDLHFWEGHYDMGGGKLLRLADRGMTLPLAMSHEISGKVAKLGPQASGLSMDKNYLVHPWLGCGACKVCRAGEENICAQNRFLGVKQPGGFAQYVVAPHPKYLVDIDGLDPAQAAPLACAGVTTYSALRKFGDRIKQEPVVIIGAGGLGLIAVTILRAMGGQAIVVDTDARKQEAALKAGAISFVDSSSADAVAQLTKATDGGARCVLDLVGANSSVTLGTQIAARGGHIVICGLMGGEITLSLPIIPMRPLRIEGSYVGNVEELRELVELTRAKQHSDTPIRLPITQRPIAEADEALQALAQGKVIGRTILMH